METAAHLEKRFIKEDSVVSRNVGGEFILVPIRKRATDVDSIYTLNEVAARIWELIDGVNTVAEIRGVIVHEYDVTPEEAEKDILELLMQLTSVGAVKEV
jgi:hypothetical protein